MDHARRIEAALKRAAVDRVPHAFWRHFPDDDRTPEGLARATLAYQERWRSDFLKVTFAGGYAVADWGCVEAEDVEPDGHRPCARHAVNAPGDWERIKPLDARRGSYGEALEAVKRIAADPRADAPVVPTLFSPLSLARKLCGDRFREDLRARPRSVEAALEAIAETQLRFAEAVLVAGASGIFYSIQAASGRHHAEEEYARLGEPHDRRILASLGPRARLVIVHGHGDQLHFGRLAGLPAGAWNWEDRATPPTLKDGLARVRGAVIGGLGQSSTLRRPDPKAVEAETRDALAQTGGRGLIVGPGCVLPLDVPDENLERVVSVLSSVSPPR